ncbi:MAG: CHASE3 domain-containing protein [Ginsengibacter sp.]
MKVAIYVDYNIGNYECYKKVTNNNMITHIDDKITNRIRWGYLVAFILLLISYIVSFTSSQNLIKERHLVNHTNEVIHDLDNIISFVIKGESSFRGYLINNDKIFLSQYRTGRDNADSTFKKLKKLTDDNQIQQIKLDTLKQLMNEKFSWCDSAIVIFDSTHKISKPVLEGNNQGIIRMIRVESFVHKIQNMERRLWVTRYGRVTKYSYTIKAFNIISLIMVILLTFYSVLTFNKENKAKLEASKNAVALREQLEMRVDELAAMNLELIELRNMEKFAVTGRISRTIAHEVRNPLTNINLASEQLRSEVQADEDINLLFEMISRNSNRINQLISDLLNSTRITDLNYTKASINDILDRSLELAQDRIKLKQINVVKNYDKDICSILVDQEKIAIAFLNIIVNAIEAMNEYGTLRITSQTKNNKCITIISDNGKGMIKADVEKFFEPFFTTKENGNGLGLTNTQNIILSHNASIHAESEPGKGTSFTMSFNFA